MPCKDNFVSWSVLNLCPCMLDYIWQLGSHLVWSKIHVGNLLQLEGFRFKKPPTLLGVLFRFQIQCIYWKKRQNYFEIVIPYSLVDFFLFLQIYMLICLNSSWSGQYTKNKKKSKGEIHLTVKGGSLIFDKVQKSFGKPQNMKWKKKKMFGMRDFSFKYIYFTRLLDIFKKIKIKIWSHYIIWRADFGNFV